MDLVIPDGARVCIVIGPEPLALPAVCATEHSAATGRSPLTDSAPSRLGHPILKSVAVGVLVLGAFVAGERIGGHGGARLALGEPQALASIPRTIAPTRMREQHAFPAAPLPAAPPPDAAPQVPPQFAQQLQQHPIVMPPPGQKSGNDPKNPFGLGN